jgi:hypothetical protein
MKIYVAFVAITVLFSSLAFGATEYIIANDNNLNDNFLTIYRLDVATGVLTKVSTIATGGRGLGDLFQNNNYTNIEQAVSPNANCIFALNAATSDIAAFSKANEYSLIGNYSNSELNSSDDGGTLAITPNGKFLYASYSDSVNVGAWTVNADCSLTFIAAYSTADIGSAGVIKVTPNGAGLVVASFLTDSGVGLFAINPTLGSLNEVGSLQLCQPGKCLIRGIDITGDSELAVFAANYENNDGVSVPIAFTTRITSRGLALPHYTNLKNPAGVYGNNMPVLGASAFAGNGSLYFGMSNGIVATNFSEMPTTITITNATLAAPTMSNGVIAVTGDTLIVGEYPNQIGVFSINTAGSITPLSTTTVQTTNPGLFSLSIFPVTR